jgi:Leu/Phe-tRNA-protein transferase
MGALQSFEVWETTYKMGPVQSFEVWETTHKMGPLQSFEVWETTHKMRPLQSFEVWETTHKMGPLQSFEAWETTHKMGPLQSFEVWETTHKMGHYNPLKCEKLLTKWQCHSQEDFNLQAAFHVKPTLPTTCTSLISNTWLQPSESYSLFNPYIQNWKEIPFPGLIQLINTDATVTLTGVQS